MKGGAGGREGEGCSSSPARPDNSIDTNRLPADYLIRRASAFEWEPAELTDTRRRRHRRVLLPLNRLNQLNRLSRHNRLNRLNLFTRLAVGRSSITRIDSSIPSPSHPLRLSILSLSLSFFLSFFLLPLTYLLKPYLKPCCHVAMLPLEQGRSGSPEGIPASDPESR